MQNHIVQEFPLPVFYHETSVIKYYYTPKRKWIFRLFSLAKIHISADWTATEQQPPASKGENVSGCGVV